MKQQMFLRVSEIPGLIGVNPYSNIRPLILRFWEKAMPWDYYNTITNLVKEDKISNPLLRDEDVIKYHSDKYDLDLDKQLKVCHTSKTTSELNKNKNELLKHVEQQSHISDMDKHVIKESLNKLTRTGYGQHHENSAIDLYCKQVNMKVIEQQKFKKKLIATSPSFQWYITGKIDGIREDGVLVEIKNRVNRLFKTLRDYEMAQVQIYLNMFRIKKGHLVECIKQGGHSSINIMEVNYDNIYWKNIVKQRLQHFIDFFYAFLASPDIKLLFLIESDINLNSYYLKNVINQSL